MISVRALTKTYKTAAGDFPALRGLDLDVSPGELIAVVGRSGSGKTTLLNLLGGIDRPTSGQVMVAGTALQGLGPDQLASWRGRNVGIVFQFFQLLPNLTVAENVMLPMDFARTVPGARRRDRALALLERVGVEDQADKLPVELSGGQQQRAAIARALANDPPLILADEPTGNLDSETGRAVFGLLTELSASGRTVVIVTHERDLLNGSSRVVALADGGLAR